MVKTRLDLRLQNEVARYYDLQEYTPTLFKRISLAVTGMIPRPYQMKFLWPIIQSVLNQEGRVFYVQLPRQTGKSQGISEAVTQLSTFIPLFFHQAYPQFANGLNSGIYGPSDETSKMLTDKIKDRVESAYYTDFLGVHADTNNSKHIRLSTRSHILTHTASPNAKFMEGPDLDLGIIEEAQAVDTTKIIKSIEPMLAARSGTLVHIFSPSHEDKEHGKVYYRILEELERRAKGLPPNPDFIIIPIEEVFRTAGTAQYRRHVLKKIREHGIEHPAIRSQYFCEWDPEEGDDYMDTKTLRKCKKGEWLEECREKCVGGLDIAKSNDDTVMEIMRLRDRQVIFWLQLKGDDYPAQSVKLRVAASRFNLIEFQAENTGPGHVLNDFLERDTELKDGRIIPQIQNLVRVNTTTDARDESFTQMKLKTQTRYYSYPDVKRREVDLFEKQMCALVSKKVGQKVRIDHRNKKGEQYKSDFPDAHRLTLDAAGQYADDYLEDSDNKRKESSGLTREDMREIDDSEEYGLIQKKRW